MWVQNNSDLRTLLSYFDLATWWNGWELKKSFWRRLTRRVVWSKVDRAITKKVLADAIHNALSNLGYAQDKTTANAISREIFVEIAKTFEKPSPVKEDSKKDVDDNYRCLL